MLGHRHAFDAISSSPTIFLAPAVAHASLDADAQTSPMLHSKERSKNNPWIKLCPDFYVASFFSFVFSPAWHTTRAPSRSPCADSPHSRHHPHHHRKNDDDDCDVLLCGPRFPLFILLFTLAPQRPIEAAPPRSVCMCVHLPIYSFFFLFPCSDFFFAFISMVCTHCPLCYLLLVGGLDS